MVCREVLGCQISLLALTPFVWWERQPSPGTGWDDVWLPLVGWVQSKGKAPELILRLWVWETGEYLLPPYAACAPKTCLSVLDGFAWDAGVERLPLLILPYLT